jgi:chemotaxis protein MotB
MRLANGLKALVLCLVVMAMMTGCTTTQKWAAGGGLVGAAIGGPWANHVGELSAAEGALVGAAAGAVAGGFIGDILDQKATDKEIADLKKQIADRDARIKELEAEIERLKAELAKGQPVKPITLTMGAEELFKPGRAKLTAEGEKVLQEMAKQLNGEYAKNPIFIEGHTDSDPIKYSNWKSNWELGAARALAITHYLAEKCNVDPKRLGALSFGEFQPRADNATADGKKQNRRASVVIWPEVKIEKQEMKK